MKKVKNIRIINYLEEHGQFPEYEIDGVAYYKLTAALISLLDDYDIQFHCFPNRL